LFDPDDDDDDDDADDDGESWFRSRHLLPYITFPSARLKAHLGAAFGYFSSGLLPWFTRP
jgi:hypothetical protein